MAILLGSLLFLVLNPVFVYELGKVSPHEQAQIITEASFAGTVFDHAQAMPERLKAMDEAHLQLFYLWLTADIGKGGITYEPGMDSAIRALAGRGTVVWLAITGATEAGAQGGEERAVTAARHVADLAAQSNLRVALYPHYGFFLPRFSDALRIAGKVSRSNLGVTFNLCHELRSGLQPDWKVTLRRAIPVLYGVTVNGADQGGRDWSTLIQPFGDGTFDSAAIVRLLVASGYRGPFGLQCYGIKADPHVYLKRARKAWDAIHVPELK